MNKRCTYAHSRQFKNVSHFKTTPGLIVSVDYETPKKVSVPSTRKSSHEKLFISTRKHSYHKPTSIFPDKYSPQKTVREFSCLANAITDTGGS